MEHYKLLELEKQRLRQAVREVKHDVFAEKGESVERARNMTPNPSKRQFSQLHLQTVWNIFIQ